MSKQVLGPTTKIQVNGTDLSQWCTQVTLADTKDQVEVTGFGETYKEFIPGLKDAEITASFVQDYGSSATDVILNAMYSATVAGTVKVTPDTGGTVVYTMIAQEYEYGPVNGAVGNENAISVTFKNSGTAGLTRGTS